jgi:hypothetical protein
MFFSLFRLYAAAHVRQTEPHGPSLELELELKDYPFNHIDFMLNFISRGFRRLGHRSLGMVL